MMLARLLPPEEWPRLAGTELETVWPHLDPEQGRIIVVEDADRIVGCWALFPVWHVEGVYIDPAYRKQGRVARRLLAHMQALADVNGIRRVMTGCLSEDVRQLLTHFDAIEVPGQQYVMEIDRLCQRSH